MFMANNSNESKAIILFVVLLISVINNKAPMSSGKAFLFNKTFNSVVS